MSVEKARIVATYTAAADRYDDGCAAFWGYFGRRTVERLSLPRGARVLDACCGTGSAALPAAEIVGPRGFVLGLDLTPALLAKAESKARERGFDHLRSLKIRRLVNKEQAGRVASADVIAGLARD